jgi:hypothetical protein
MVVLVKSVVYSLRNNGIHKIGGDEVAIIKFGGEWRKDNRTILFFGTGNFVLILITGIASVDARFKNSRKI